MPVKQRTWSKATKKQKEFAQELFSRSKRYLDTNPSAGVMIEKYRDIETETILSYRTREGKELLRACCVGIGLSYYTFNIRKNPRLKEPVKEISGLQILVAKKEEKEIFE